MTIEILYSIVFFIIGIVFGSFFNVVGYRLPNNMSLIKPSSHCPNCKHKLKPIELIPVFSWLFQLGKCKKCHQPIPFFYPFFELLTGILFMVAYNIFGLTIYLIIPLIFISSLIIIMISDFKYMIIPDEVLLFAIITITLAKLFIYGPLVTGKSILAGLILMTIMYLIKKMGDLLFKRESMGGGDIKLMFLFGLTIGIVIGLTSIFVGSFIALPVALIIYALKRTRELPFGPFLSIAALLLFLIQVDSSTLKIWFGF